MPSTGSQGLSFFAPLPAEPAEGPKPQPDTDYIPSPHITLQGESPRLERDFHRILSQARQFRQAPGISRWELLMNFKAGKPDVNLDSTLR